MVSITATLPGRLPGNAGPRSSWEWQDQAGAAAATHTIERVTRSNALGEYLRARRELVDPADAGLRVTGVRRTPGLRREEVATLAGISADYYLRLEQGRDRNPSAQVLEALARRVRAGRDGHAVPAEPVRPPARRRRGARAARRCRPASGSCSTCSALPAFVENRMFDVLAANRLATALSPAIRPGENRLRSVFLDAGEQRPAPRLGAGGRGHGRRVPRLDRHRRRRPADRPARRRAVAGQRAVPAAVGAARRQAAGRRAGADAPPAGRAAGAAPREAARSATRAASCW